MELHCTYDPSTRGGTTPDGRKVKSTIHWVSAAHVVDWDVGLYKLVFDRTIGLRDTWSKIERREKK